MKKLPFVLITILFFVAFGCSKKDSPMPARIPPVLPTLSSAKDITAFSFTKGLNTTLDADVITSINVVTHAITTTVPFGTNVTALIPGFSNSSKSVVKVGSTVQTSGVSANNYSAPVTYSVTAEDGSSQNYTVTLAIAAGHEGINVYVAGNIEQGGKTVAVYWKNGVITKLTNGSKNASALSIAVSGNDVYVAGWEDSMGEITAAKFWKNGVATALTDGTDYAYASSIVIKGADVYIAGSEGNGQGLSLARLWKNGVGTTLQSNATIGANAQTVVIYGNDVYVSGNDFYESYKIGKYWKNGVETILPGGKSAETRSIAVNSDGVYVTGFEPAKNNTSNYEVKYWKNGVSNFLTDGSENSIVGTIVLSGTDVFIAGVEGNKAKYWKNGVASVLNGSYVFAGAGSIAVDGTDVYVGGWQNFGTSNYPTLWKNGVAKSLTDNSTPGSANFITLVN